MPSPDTLDRQKALAHLCRSVAETADKLSDDSLSKDDAHTRFFPLFAQYIRARMRSRLLRHGSESVPSDLVNAWRDELIEEVAPDPIWGFQPGVIPEPKEFELTEQQRKDTDAYELAGQTFTFTFGDYENCEVGGERPGKFHGAWEYAMALYARTQQGERRDVFETALQGSQRSRGVQRV